MSYYIITKTKRFNQSIAQLVVPVSNFWGGKRYAHVTLSTPLFSPSLDLFVARRKRLVDFFTFRLLHHLDRH